MNVLKLEGDADTPEVLLDKGKAVFEISGRSLPEDTVTFYKPIMDWIDAYALEPNPSTDFAFKLDYFNTASSKLILDMLIKLAKIKGIKIDWYSRDDDEEIMEAGKEFSEQVDIPFEFKTF